MPISPFSPSLLFLDVAPINQTNLNPGLGGWLTQSTEIRVETGPGEKAEF